MKYEDDELKNLIKPLSNLEPNEFEIHKWKKAINKETQSSRISFSKLGWVAQLVAATLFGVAMSTFFLNKTEPSRPFSDSQIVSFNDATFERSHTKLD